VNDHKEIYEGPFIGLGLGIDVHGEKPDWRALVDQDTRPFDFLEVFTRGDAGIAAEVRERVGPDFPLIYHHENLELVYPSPVSETAVSAAAINLNALSAPWCIEELAYREIEGRYLDFFMPALLTEESARSTIEKIKAINARIPSVITPENPPYQLPVGDLHILDFMKLVGEGADVPLILDLGHLYSYQLCVGLNPLDELKRIPLERVIELHVAGANLVDIDGVTIYEDSHGADLIPEVLLEMLSEVFPQCPHIRAVTIEVEDADNERVLSEVKRVRSVLDSLAGGSSRGA
jgi:uncharacterized protein